MRRDADTLISCELSSRERDAAEEMKARTGLASDADLVRTALARFAVFLEPHFDTKLFAVRHDRKRR